MLELLRLLLAVVPRALRSRRDLLLENLFLWQQLQLAPRSQLIEAGQKQQGVRSDAVGLYGMSAGGAAALNVIASRSDIRAAVVDSGVVGGAKATRIKSPVLILAGTADASISSFKAQKDYAPESKSSGTTTKEVKRCIDFLSRRLVSTV
jgi:alpha-beta hydrolase superfamily lysophospholipase